MCDAECHEAREQHDVKKETKQPPTHLTRLVGEWGRDGARPGLSRDQLWALIANIADRWIGWPFLHILSGKRSKQAVCVSVWWIKPRNIIARTQNYRHPRWMCSDKIIGAGGQDREGINLSSVVAPSLPNTSKTKPRLFDKPDCEGHTFSGSPRPRREPARWDEASAIAIRTAEGRGFLNGFGLRGEAGPFFLG